MQRASITRRLTLLFAGTLSAGFLALGWYMSTAIDQHFIEIDEAALDNAIQRVGYVLNNEIGSGSANETGSGDLAGLHNLIDSMMAGHDRASVWVATDTGESLAADSEIAFPRTLLDSALAKATLDKSVLFTWEAEQHEYRGMAARLHAQQLSASPIRVAAAINIDHHRQFMSMFRGALWLAIAAAIVVSVLISIGIARSGVRPLRQLARQMDAISSQRLSQRLVTDDIPVELVGLANAFNAMLARLDVSFARLSQFSADIAHELRTPVSNLLTQTQVMLSKQRSAEEYRDVLASNAEELERLSRMVSDMLFLARTGNERGITSVERVDAAHEVHDLFEFYEALAAEQSVSLELSGTVTLEADRLMLRRAINNLLSNAIRYTPAGGTVRVSLSKTRERAIFDVTNPGTPIPESQRERLFERFYRADAARSRDSDGAGLGLSIVKAIARAHGGDVSVTSTDGSNTFSMWFPLHAERSDPA